MEHVKKPVFKKREVIVRIPRGDAFSPKNQVEAQVVHIGKDSVNYKEDDTILVDMARCVELKYFKDELYKIDHEDYIICQLLNNE